jgi:hypothetical protein
MHLWYHHTHVSPLIRSSEALQPHLVTTTPYPVHKTAASPISVNTNAEQELSMMWVATISINIEDGSLLGCCAVLSG